MSRPVLRSVSLFSLPGDSPIHEDHIQVDDDRGILSVSDGFGGPEPGARAARLSCESVHEFLKREAGDEDATLPFELREFLSLSGNILFNAILHANRRMLDGNEGKGVHERGGASHATVYLDSNHPIHPIQMTLANIGNTSVWIFRGSDRLELARPRSYGRFLDPFGLKDDRRQQVPTVALGISEDVEPEIVETRIERGDWVLLQTASLGVDFVDRVSKLRDHRDPSLVPHEFEELGKSIQTSANRSAVLAVF